MAPTLFVLLSLFAVGYCSSGSGSGSSPIDCYSCLYSETGSASDYNDILDTPLAIISSATWTTRMTNVETAYTNGGDVDSSATMDNANCADPASSSTGLATYSLANRCCTLWLYDYAGNSTWWRFGADSANAIVATYDSTDLDNYYERFNIDCSSSALGNTDTYTAPTTSNRAEGIDASDSASGLVMAPVVFLLSIAAALYQTA